MRKRGTCNFNFISCGGSCDSKTCAANEHCATKVCDGVIQWLDCAPDEGCACIASGGTWDGTSCN